jgi:uncharacterized protein YciI
MCPLSLQSVRGEYADQGGLREIVDIKDEELLDLATQLRIKDKELEEGRARAAVLKARADQMAGEVQRMGEVERRLVVAQDNEAKLQEAMEALEDDLDRLHRENAALKRALRQARGGPADTPGKPNAGVGALSPGPGIDIADMSDVGSPLPLRDAAATHGHGHVAALQAAVQALRADNARLRAEAARRGVAALPSLAVPDNRAVAHAAARATSSVRLLHVCSRRPRGRKGRGGGGVKLTPYRVVHGRCSARMQEVQALAASARVAEVGVGGARIRLQAQRDMLKALHGRSARLLAAGPAPDPDQWCTPPSQFQFQPGAAPIPIPIGRIKMPGDAAAASTPSVPSRSVTLDHASFNALHAVFAM